MVNIHYTKVSCVKKFKTAKLQLNGLWSVHVNSNIVYYVLL